MKKKIPPYQKGLDQLAKSRELYKEAKLEESLEAAIRASEILEQYDASSDLGEALRRAGVLHYKLCNYTESLVHFRRSAAVHHSTGDIVAEGTVRRLIGNSQMILGDHEGALQELQEGERLFRQAADGLGIGSTLDTIGQLYTRIGKYEEALKVLLESVDILSQEPIDREHLRLHLTYSILNTAGAFIQSGNPRSALVYMEKALEFAEKFQHADIYNDMGAAHSKLGDDTKALKYFRQAYAVLKKLPEPRFVAVAVVAQNLADMYKKSGRRSLAIRYTQQACSHFEKSKDLSKLIDSLVQLSNLYIDIGQKTKAFPMLERALALATEIDLPLPLKLTHEGLSRYYEELRNYELALKHYQRSQAIYHRIIDSETQQKMESLKLRFEMERELKEKEIHRRNDVIQAIIDTQETERQRIARDLHDGVGQMLAAASINLAQVYKMVNHRELRGYTSAEVNASLERSIEIIDRTISDVRTISHMLGTSTLRELGLIVALSELLANLEAHETTRFEFSAVNMEERLSEQLEMGLFRVAQELISNVLHHSGATEATVHIMKEEQEIRLTVEDNGKGFDAVAVNGGMGHRNIAGRISAMGGQLYYDSTPGHGTMVMVTVRDRG